MAIWVGKSSFVGLGFNHPANIGEHTFRLARLSKTVAATSQAIADAAWVPWL
jgi:hypothetical protein